MRIARTTLKKQNMTRYKKKKSLNNENNESSTVLVPEQTGRPSNGSGDPATEESACCGGRPNRWLHPMDNFGIQPLYLELGFCPPAAGLEVGTEAWNEDPWTGLILTLSF